jgi:pantoate--beta-alanine ligase
VRRHAAEVSGVSLEYVSAADPLTLAELRAPAERAVVSLAARVGRARLIDNVLVGMDVSDLS